MSQKQQIKVGGFLLEKETATSKIKVSHESGRFSFRIHVPDTDNFFKAWTEKEYEKAWEMIFSSIMLFSNYSLTNAVYFTEWAHWNESFFKRMQKEVSDQEHEEALNEVMDDFDMAEKAKEMEAKSAVKSTSDETEQGETCEDTADGIGYETARNTPE